MTSTPQTSPDIEGEASDQQPDAERERRYHEFVRLYTGAYHSIYSFTLSLVPSTDAADDIVQETAVLLWQKFDDFASGTNFERWARAFVRNIVRNVHRTRRPASLSFDDSLLAKIAETRLAADEWLDIRRSALQACMSHLPLAERRLVRICYAEHDSISTAAGELNLKLNAVYKKLRRIRIKLFRCVEKRLGLKDSP